MSLIATTLVFFVPLVYTTNQELIDHHLKNASDAINAQTSQVRSVAGKQAEQITSISKQYAGDYTAKVQDLLGNRSVSGSSPARAPEFPSPPTDEPRKTPLDVPTEPIVSEKDTLRTVPAS